MKNGRWLYVVIMVPTTRLLEFAGVAAIIIAIPGPSVLFTVSRALTAGRRTALLTVLGNEAGLMLQAVAVAFGMGVVVERSAGVFTAVKLLGAGYLIYLGVKAVRHRRSLAEAVGARTAPVRPLRALADGVIVGAMNPKTIVFFAAILPQFTDRAASNPVPQMLLLGVLFSSIALVLDSVWAVAAGAAGQWLSRSPRRLAAIGGTGGLVMIGLGVSLAATGRKD
jgi:threonine/homoserine/homoserine lactone efflux protein